MLLLADVVTESKIEAVVKGTPETLARGKASTYVDQHLGQTGPSLRGLVVHTRPV